MAEKSKIVFLKNYFKKTDNLFEKVSEKQREQRVHQNRILVLISLIVVTIVTGGIICLDVYRQMSETKEKIVIAKQKLKKVDQENNRLLDQLKQLNDPDYIDKIIRYKYSYTKKGEQNFEIPDGGVLADTKKDR